MLHCNTASQTTRVANLKSDTSTISQFSYLYDPAGNRTRITTADGSVTTYSYDATYRLTEEYRTSNGESWSALSADDWGGLTADGWGTLTSTSGSYRNTFTYDPTGNRLVKNASGAITTSTYDVANQLVTSLDSSGTTTYSFDADGNQILTVAPNGDRTTTTWDYENKTTLIQLPSGLRNTMAYDPDGLRVQLDDSAGTTRFLYDGQAYLLEANSSNVVQAVYSQEPSAYGNAISQYRFDGTLWIPSYYHGDVLGSTSDLTDTGENVTDSYQYDAWGELLARIGTTANPFQWIGGVGYYRDPDTEHYYVRARIYQPTSGRWRSQDPLGFVDGMNLYRAYFISGNSDPSGLGISYPWTSPADLITHYLFNGGTSVELGNDDQTFTRWLSQTTNSIKAIQLNIANNVSKNTLCGESKSISGSLTEQKVFMLNPAQNWTYGFRDPIYIINQSLVNVSYNCTPLRTCCPCSMDTLRLSVRCTYSFALIDKFANPFDYGVKEHGEGYTYNQQPSCKIGQSGM